MGALTDYRNATLALLHDGLQQFYTEPTLTTNINEARNRVAADTKCLRQIVTGVSLTAAQELYTISTTLTSPAGIGARVLEVYSVTIYWGTMRIICRNLSFTEQNAKLRLFQSYTTRPGSVARINPTQVYINPTPDQAYVSDWDVSLTPVALASDSDTEVIPPPYNNCVKFYAAHLSKYNEQSMGEAQMFLERYYTERLAVNWATRSMLVQDAYRK